MKCMLCGGKTDVMFHELDMDGNLITICYRCHNKNSEEEFNGEGIS